LKAEIMALVSGSKLPLLKTVMLEVHFPSSPMFRIEALFLIHKKKKEMPQETVAPGLGCHFLKLQQSKSSAPYLRYDNPVQS